MNALTTDFDGLGIEIDDQFNGDDDRLGMTLGATNDRVNAATSSSLWNGFVM